MFGLGLAGLLIILNGFFVAAEFALVKLRATRGVRTKPTTKRDLQLQQAVERLDRYLAVTQLGITFASLCLGWIGEPAVSELCEELVLGLTGQALGNTGRGIMT